jgi:hypothetical protein
MVETNDRWQNDGSTAASAPTPSDIWYPDGYAFENVYGHFLVNQRK